MNAAHSDFTTAMGAGMRVAAGVALAGAVLSVVLLRRHGAPVADVSDATKPLTMADPVLGAAAATPVPAAVG
jgi:hypothetical protein